MTGLRSQRSVEPVRVGVVGLGLMGREHARVLAASPWADLVGCVDPRAEARAAAPEGVRVFSDYPALFGSAGLEAVFVATPEDHHRAPVEAALAAGLHVFVEKPIATTLEDADAMIAAAESAQRRLVTGHILRFDPRYVAAHAEIEAGRLGEIVHLVARRNCVLEEGRYVAPRASLPMYMSIHDLDIMQWYAGGITRVYAEASRRGLAGEGALDTVVATLRFASGAVGTMETCWSLPDESGLAWDTALSCVGTRACAYIDIRAMGVTVLGAGGVRFPETTYWPMVHGEPVGILRAQDEHFLASLRDGRRAAQSATEARSALALTLALERSLETGGPVAT